MDRQKRINMVKAMEYIVRSVNDETLFDIWLSIGVADGDIAYGDLSSADDGELDYYIEDDSFATLMDLFLRIMKHASKSGGLYCDDIVSRSSDDWC